MLRLLLITTAYPSSEEDPRGTFIRQLAHGLRHEGVQVQVLTLGAAGAPASEEQDGIKIRRAPYWLSHANGLATGVGGILPNLRRRPWLAAQLPSLVGTLAYHAVRMARSADVVHAHWVYPSGLAGLLAARRAGAPLVVTSHGGDLNVARRVWPLKALAYAVAKRADRCIGVSHAMVEQFLELGIAPEQVSFIPLGVDVPANPRTVSDGMPGLGPKGSLAGFRIAYVGSLIPRKAVHTLLEAHAELERRGQQIATLIVGDGPSEPDLRALAQRLHLTNVHFLGEQPPSLIPAWIAATDVLVLPSRSEGRGMVLLEAMALGIPVIASDIPGPREVVIDGSTGFLFPPGDAVQLADCLERLIRDGTLGHSLGKQGQALLIEQGLTTTQSARRHVEVYDQLLTSKRRSSDA